MNKTIKLSITTAVLVLLALILLLSSFTTIDAGQVGITTIGGKPSKNLLDPGYNWVNPIASVHKINIRASTITDDSQGASSDLQNVQTKLTMVYSVNPAKVIRLYSVVGDSEQYLQQGIIQPAMGEAFKSVIADYNASELIDNRAEVSARMTKQIQEKLEPYGIIVQMVSVTNFQFSGEFNQAIEAKVTAEQKVLTLKQQLQQAIVESQITLTKAQANANAMKMQAQTVTPEMIQLEMIKKWNGVLPTTTAGNSIPMLNMSK